MTYDYQDLQSKPTKKLIRLAVFSGVAKPEALKMTRELLITRILSNPPERRLEE